MFWIVLAAHRSDTDKEHTPQAAASKQHKSRNDDKNETATTSHSCKGQAMPRQLVVMPRGDVGKSSHRAYTRNETLVRRTGSASSPFSPWRFRCRPLPLPETEPAGSLVSVLPCKPFIPTTLCPRLESAAAGEATPSASLRGGSNVCDGSPGISPVSLTRAGRRDRDAILPAPLGSISTCATPLREFFRRCRLWRMRHMWKMLTQKMPTVNRLMRHRNSVTTVGFTLWSMAYLAQQTAVCVSHNWRLQHT